MRTKQFHNSLSINKNNTGTINVINQLHSINQLIKETKNSFINHSGIINQSELLKVLSILYTVENIISYFSNQSDQQKWLHLYGFIGDIPTNPCLQKYNNAVNNADLWFTLEVIDALLLCDIPFIGPALSAICMVDAEEQYDIALNNALRAYTNCMRQ